MIHLKERINVRDAARPPLRILVAILIALPRSLWANPTGGEVAAGSAGISSSGGTLTVIQASNNAIINWRDFSINQGELTQFIQPSALSAALNRVTGGNPSAVYGTLQANGRVFLINPNGIAVGPTGVINTQGFVASTLDLNNDEFMAGGALRFSGSSAANLINAGRITALGGDVLLIAHTVQNTGEIVATHGTAALAAGTEVLIQPGGDERVFVKAGGSDKAAVGVDQQGRIAAATAELKAAGGNVYSLAINNAGLVQATGVERRGGRVYLVAEGGDIALKSGSVIDASGADGGGTVLVGGDSQGLNPDVPNASVVTVEAGAAIKADALENGDGGKVVVWGTDAASFRGLISAKGGVEGGNGGNVEVSGGHLDFDGMADARAPQGLLGTLLLDPWNLRISDSAQSGITGTFASDSGASNLNVVTLQNQLNTANVTVRTGDPAGSSQPGDITVDSAVTWNHDSTLTLQAHNDITVNAPITNNDAGSNAGVTMLSNSGGSNPGAAINLNAGVATAGGVQTYDGRVNLQADETLTAGGGSVVFNGVVSGAHTLTVDAGLIAVNGGTVNTGAQTYNGALALGDDTTLISNDGDVTVNGAVGGRHALTIDPGAGVIRLNGGTVDAGAQSYYGNVVLGGDTTLISNGGDVALNGRVGGLHALTVAPGAGVIRLNGGTVSTGAQTYDGEVALGDDTALISHGGDAVFNGKVGGLHALLIDPDGGVIRLNGGTVDTGAQSYYGNVALGGDTALISNGGDVALNGKVGGLHALAVDSGAGVIRLNGGTVNTGAQTYDGRVALGDDTTLISNDGDVALNRRVDGLHALLIDPGAGVIKLNGGTVSTGAQSYYGSVELGDDMTLISNGGDVAFNGRVDGLHALAVDPGAGVIRLNGGTLDTGAQS
ncbi:MAG: filamentous hemagglutinin N-terminal domain-containing protein, partial [Elusimicrobia bacterium]|nr:filamentous hemagglutinin N-terminal domain-containing protein [Elusimicrobiota bacterium]